MYSALYKHIENTLKTHPPLTDTQTVHIPWLPSQLGYKGWHKHYRAMSRSSLWATGLWVWPYVSRLPCLLHAPCGLCEQHRVSNVILWTLGGKKSQSSLKRERQKKREEVIQSHVWNRIWGGRYDQRLLRRRMAGAHCVSPWSTVNACQHMFEHACAHIVYVARKLSVSSCFF